MLIVSKYKDYYDYLQGIWGVDELRVLDRTEYTPMPYLPEINTIERFIIGDYFIEGVYAGKELGFLYGDGLILYLVPAKKNKYWWNNKKTELYYTIELPGQKQISILKAPIKDSDKIADKLGHPILIKGVTTDYKSSYLKNPILSEYDFGRALSPDDIWIILSDWLGKEKVIPNNQTDKEKVVAAGFDLKKSFRHRK
ncbi:MAG: hypothetical protein ABIP51_18260 [Bacteroidia bacterium]